MDGKCGQYAYRRLLIRMCWQNFMSDRQFCFRACKPGPMATTYCQHIYDVMGCDWNMPGNYDAGVFERCLGDDGEVCMVAPFSRT